MTRRVPAVAVGFAYLALVACVSQPSPVSAQQEKAGVPGNVIRAPEFPDDAVWLNVDRPLRLADLRGKVVLLDFWTYCCINCMHILPELKKLERKYADSLVVIGIHSAKFEGEQDTENIRQAIRRYEIEHPVLNDADFRVWQAYAARAWPTLALIDPEGRYLGSQSGEITFDEFDPVIARVVAEAEAAGALKRGPLDLALEAHAAPRTLLSYPGKILADEAGGRLIIADSTHHRYVIVGLDGTVRDVIGAGTPGFDDGSFETATFRKPQGLALDGDQLYLADTENHAVRVADLRARTVTTLAGRGAKPRRLNSAGAGREVSLHSPWDLLLHGGMLYVAMAGPHQIWTINPRTAEARPYAGSGREEILDGPRFVAADNGLGADPMRTAALAQPSGLATDGERLYWADSETSSIRGVPFGPADSPVSTYVGEGLFDFGDVDGPRAVARLQHPLHVLYHRGKLYVADTYNNKIKVLDPRRNELTTFAGSGREGAEDGAEATFDEPGGLAVIGDTLYVADTNNHAIRTIDLATGVTGTLMIRDADRAAPPALAGYPTRVVKLPPQTVRPGDGGLDLTLIPAAGFKLNPGAPLVVRLRSDGAAVSVADERLRLQDPTFPLRLPATFAAGTANLTVTVEAYTCREGENGACVYDQIALELPITVADGGASSARVEAGL